DQVSIAHLAPGAPSPWHHQQIDRRVIGEGVVRPHTQAAARRDQVRPLRHREDGEGWRLILRDARRDGEYLEWAAEIQHLHVVEDQNTDGAGPSWPAPIGIWGLYGSSSPAHPGQTLPDMAPSTRRLPP